MQCSLREQFSHRRNGGVRSGLKGGIYLGLLYFSSAFYLVATSLLWGFSRTGWWGCAYLVQFLWPVFRGIPYRVVGNGASFGRGAGIVE